MDNPSITNWPDLTYGTVNTGPQNNTSAVSCVAIKKTKKFMLNIKLGSVTVRASALPYKIAFLKAV
jgi:hypothetical protein